MTRQTVIRRVLLLVAVHAEAHVVIDGALGDRHGGEIAVTGLAVYARADVRRVVETDVRFAGEAVDALPRDLEALVGVAGHLLDQRPVGRNLTVADHAGLDAGDAGDRTLVGALVAVGADRLLGDVGLVRKRNRLDRGGT